MKFKTAVNFDREYNMIVQALMRLRESLFLWYYIGEGGCRAGAGGTFDYFPIETPVEVA